MASTPLSDFGTVPGGVLTQGPSTLEIPLPSPPEARDLEVPDVGFPVADEPELPVVGYVEQRGPQVRRAPPSPAQAFQSQAPSQKVTFEIDAYGSLESFYHQVIHKDDFLALVYDLRFQGPKSFPRHSESTLGLHVDGTDKLFLIRTTGIQFVVGYQEICVLVIENERSYSSYLARQDGRGALRLEDVVAAAPAVQEDGKPSDHEELPGF